MQCCAPARCGSSPKWQQSPQFCRFFAEHRSMGERTVQFEAFGSASPTSCARYVVHGPHSLAFRMCVRMPIQRMRQLAGAWCVACRSAPSVPLWPPCCWRASSMRIQMQLSSRVPCRSPAGGFARACGWAGVHFRFSARRVTPGGREFAHRRRSAARCTAPSA